MKLFLFFFFFFLCPLISQGNDDNEFIRQPPRPDWLMVNNFDKHVAIQVHVSLAGKDHMRVTFTTEDKNVDSVVEYGKRPGKYDKKTTGESTSYKYFLYTSPKIHHVKIGPLQPNTTYYFRCGGHGEEFYLKTTPSTFPVAFVIAGDLGQTQWTIATLTLIKRADYDVFLLSGDLSYADSHQPFWDTFGLLAQVFATRRPWMVTHGNHEIESFPILEHTPFKAFDARWLMPHVESQSESNLFYSFDVVGVHTIMLGSYADFDSRSDQYRWLQADLGKIDRKTTPWVVVVMHVPWYNTNKAHEGEGEGMRKAMESLLFHARVDVVFAGHIHSYERFTRIYDNKANPCGPIYITIGDAGNRERHDFSYKWPASPLSLFRESSFGFGKLNIIDEKRAHWEWHRDNDINTIVADEIWLENLSKSSSCWPSNHTSKSSFKIILP